MFKKKKVNYAGQNKTNAEPEKPKEKISAINKVDVKLEDYCVGCANMEPEIDVAKAMYGNKLIHCIVHIYCKHFQKCAALSEHFKEKSE